MIGEADGRPTAILFRQIATPNYELRSFLRTCRRRNFQPVLLTYHQDRMSCHNVYKRALVAPVFVEKINRLGQPVWRRRAITKPELVEQKRLCEIELAGQTLPDLHERLLRNISPSPPFRLVEGSTYFGKYVHGARDYYVDLFLGLNGNCVLLEDFRTDDDDEKRFYAEIVRPAFETARQTVGVAPHIMRLIPGRFTNSPLWYAYPDSYRAHFQAVGVNL